MAELKKMVKALCENYGIRVKFDNVEVVACPSARKVAEVSEEELREKCRLGYRASYLRYNANLVANGEILPLRELESLSSIEEAKKILRKMRGIGEYSSEIILFSLYPCFPVDSWSAEIFAKVFKIEGSSRSLTKTVKAYAEKNFGEWQSYVYDYIINDFENLGFS
jgi:N-glycosylase/DNA lyase